MPPGRPRDRSAAVLVAALVLAGLATAATALADPITGGDVTAADLLGDTTELAGAPWYTGGLTTLTVLVWAAAATALLLLAAVTRQRHELSAPAAQLGAITLVLALDDQFQLHEVAIPWVLGLPERVTFAAYGIAVAAVLVRHRTTLRAQPEWPVIGTALAAFATSVALDQVGAGGDARRLTEEGTKLLGVLCWAGAPAVALVRLTRPSPAPRPAMPEEEHAQR